MLDHVFTDAIGALRDAFSNAYLERQAFEEHFQSDILLGDLVWETTYGLPGEGLPPRVVAHITLNWPSWSQATYRQWYIEEEIDQQPAIEIEVVFRIQRLAEQPAPAIVDGIAACLSHNDRSCGLWSSDIGILSGCAGRGLRLSRKLFCAQGLGRAPDASGR